MRNSSLVFSLLALGAAAPIAAQGPAIVPQAYANTFGNTNNNIPFSWTPVRYQQPFLGSEMPKVLFIRGLGLRQDDGFSGFTGYAVDLEIKLGYTTLDHTTVGNVYDSNFDVTSPAPINVLKRGFVKLPNMPPTMPTNPQDFFIKIPFTTPMTWLQVANRNLLIEVVNWGNTNGNQIFTFPLDAANSTTTTRLYSSAPTDTSGTLGRGYGHIMAFLDKVPVTADYTLYGAGCTGSNGVPALSNTNRPLINSTFSVDLAQAAASSVALLALGISDQQWGAFVLPLDLTPAGAPGCKLLASLDILGGVATSSSGTASAQFPLPNDTNLVGVVLFNQWLVIDPAANALKIAFSNGGRMLIGDQ